MLEAIKHVYPEVAALVDGADPKIKSKTWDDSKISAHHGIIPTMHQGGMAGLSEKERNIYDLIVCAHLAQFYPQHESTLPRPSRSTSPASDSRRQGRDAQRMARRVRRSRGRRRQPGAAKHKKRGCRVMREGNADGRQDDGTQPLHRGHADARDGKHPQIGHGRRA